MKISAAESRVLDVLWKSGALDVMDATAALSASEGWSDETVRTLLRRLIAKKAVEKVKDGRRTLYRAIVDRAAYAQAESETLVDRFFEGRLSPLVVQFAQHRKLTKDDVETLKRLIAELEDDGE